MASSTVLRVKRRLEANPQDALVLMCKRKKTDAEELSPSLFVFLGTVDSQETSHVKKIVPKTEIKLKTGTKVSEIIQKIRKERQEVSTESRYKVVNCSRGLKEDVDVEDDDVFDLVDLQEKLEQEESEAKYAYDLYTAAKQDFDISMIDDLVHIEHYETDLVFGSYRDNGQTSSTPDEDEDDPNDENNWRNDYPESEPSSIDEADMIQAVERFDIEDDLSSDAGEDKIYDGPPDLSNEDVKRYGAAYAQYKARVVAEQPDLADSNNFVHCTTEVTEVKDLDEELVDGYKEDSDDGFYYGQEEDTDQFKQQYFQEADIDSPD